MTVTSPLDRLAPFAEDPGAFVAIGQDEERILSDRYCVTFGPGGHFWSTSVERLRFGANEVDASVTEIRDLMTARGRKAAVWRVGPSARPEGLHELLLATGMESESNEGSLILVLTEPPRVTPSAFDMRLVSTYEEHLAAIEVGNQAFGFPSADALHERRRARATFESERVGGHSVRLLALDGDRPVATGRGWFSRLGLYLGGGATLPSDRGRGAMSTLIAAAWGEAVRRGTPCLVTHAGTNAAPTLEKMGFRSMGRVRHFIDRGSGGSRFPL